MINFFCSISDTIELIRATRGEIPADIVIKNGTLINVVTAEIYKSDIAVKNRYIIAVGDVDYCIGKDTTIINAKNKYISPGLIETHIHVSGSHLSMPELARVLISHGTTSISTDFCHIAIVAGIEGIRFFQDSINNTPLKNLFVVPTSGYFQNRQLGFAPTPSALTIDHLKQMLDWPECIGLGETTYEILKDDMALIELFSFAKNKNKVITGTGTGAKGIDLNAYIFTGGKSDHEMKSAIETIEKARLGIHMHIREGSAASDLNETIRAITEYKIDPRYFMFCTDEEEPARLKKIGNIDYKIKMVIERGLNPITAFQMATINAAEFLKASEYIGSIVPGKIADIVLVDSLEEINVSTVIVNGKLVFDDYDYFGGGEPTKYPSNMTHSIKYQRNIKIEDINIVASSNESVLVNVILAKEGSLISDHLTARLKVKNRKIESDTNHDILKIVMIERHSGSGKIGIGFIKGFELKEGAIAESFSPMSENIVAVGVDDESICFAVNKLKEIGGGQIAVKKNQILGLLELPILGLISDSPLDEVIRKTNNLSKAVSELGCKFRSPFMTLGFMCLSPLGKLKISERGLFDCEAKEVVPLIKL